MDVSGVDVEEIDRGDGNRLNKLGVISLNWTVSTCWVDILVTRITLFVVTMSIVCVLGDRDDALMDDIDDCVVIFEDNDCGLGVFITLENIVVDGESFIVIISCSVVVTSGNAIIDEFISRDSDVISYNTRQNIIYIVCILSYKTCWF